MCLVGVFLVGVGCCAAPYEGGLLMGLRSSLFFPFFRGGPLSNPSGGCRFSDLMGRKDRCECAPTDNDAKRCFWLTFDQQAFIAASLRTEDELHKMFRERLVWENPSDIALLRSKGLLTRIYGPQVRPKARALV